MRKLVIAAITAGAGIAFTPVADSNTVSCGNTVPCGGNVGSLSGATVRLYTQSGAGVLLHDPGSPSIVPFEITPGVQGKSNLVLSGAGSGGVGMTINAGNTMQFQIGGTTELTVGAATKVKRSRAMRGLSVRSATDITRFSVPGLVGGRTAVQRVSVTQETAIHLSPTFSWSAPGLGMKPEPPTVTRVGRSLGPTFGETPVMMLELSFLPVRKQVSAASPG